jgi:hypothetical protein
MEFIHIRFHEPNRSVKAKGGYTFCFSDSGDGKCGASKCHERDNYNKREGRVKAQGRMISEKFSFSVLGLDPEKRKGFAMNMARSLESADMSFPADDQVVHCITLANADADVGISVLY